MRYALVSVLAGCVWAAAPKASAAGFGCESVAGSVVFKDTLYGILTGSLLSGLYILSKDKDHRKDSGEKLASGASIGGLLGFGLGVTEIAIRECPPARYGEEKGFSTSFAAVPTAEGHLDAGWRMSWRF